MDRYSDVVQNENGRAVPDASIQILDQDGRLATIYADRAGAKLDNPLITDVLGRWSFCAADGVYSANVYLNGVLKATLQDIRLEDPDNGIGALAGPSGASLVGTASGTVQGALDTLAGSVAGLKNYTLPPATTSALGGVKIGSGLAVSADGTVSATGLVAGTVAKVNNVLPDGAGSVTITTDNLPEGANPVNQWFTTARVRAVLLAGLNTATNAVVTATDTLLEAVGKLQAQISTKQDAAAKDASGGYAGLTGFAINIKNAAGTIASKIVSAATAARTWTMPDKDGTVALLSDLQPGMVVQLASYPVTSTTGTIDLSACFTAQCDEVAIVMSGMQTSTTGTYTMQVVIGGVLQTGTNYYLGTGDNTTLSSAGHFVLHGTTSLAPGVFNAKIVLLNVNGAVIDKTILIDGSHIDSTGSARRTILRRGAFGGVVGALSGFKLQAAGNFSAGTVRVYGIKNS